MKQIYHLHGLSTDTKPVMADMATGSTYEELDTGIVFIFNAIQNAWLLQQVPPPGAPIAVGIRAICKTSTDDNVDTYTIYYTNGTQTTFTVTNGKDGVGTNVGYGLQLDSDNAIEIDDSIVATWNKIVANKEGEAVNKLSSIDINGILYQVGTGTGLGLSKVELNNENILIFTLADDSMLECSLQQLVDALEEKINAVNTKVDTVAAELNKKTDDLANKISEESKRATDVETDLDNKISTEAETRETEDQKIRDELKVIYNLISDSGDLSCTLSNQTVFTYNSKEISNLHLYWPTEVKQGFISEVIFLGTTESITLPESTKLIQYGKRIAQADWDYSVHATISLLFQFDGINKCCYITEVPD